MYAIFTKDLSETNKSLVWADCSQKQLAVVTVDNYQAFLKESGYDLLGNKLPSWEAADYNALLAVLIQTKSAPSGQSVFFDIACNWDSLPSI